MLNRFWTVATVTAVCAFCTVGVSQEKKKSGVAPPTGGESLQIKTYKPVPKEFLAKLPEKTRAIGGTGSSAPVFANPEALWKVIEEMGVKVIKSDPAYRVVEVNGWYAIVEMTKDNSFVLVHNWLAFKDGLDISSIPPQKLLSMMEAQNPLGGCWMYSSSENALHGMAAITAVTGSREELRFKLDFFAQMLANGYENLKSVVK